MSGNVQAVAPQKSSGEPSLRDPEQYLPTCMMTSVP